MHVSDAQKSYANEKDLLQIHVFMRWVRRNHTTVHRYYTCVLTQIDMGVRRLFIFIINCSLMCSKYCYAKCIKDMLLSAYLVLIWHKNGSE